MSERVDVTMRGVTVGGLERFGCFQEAVCRTWSGTDAASIAIAAAAISDDFVLRIYFSLRASSIACLGV